MPNYDVIVLGAGPGGYTAAIRSAQLGLKVCLIEEDKIGGTCLNRGCIPTKALLTSAGLFSKIKKAKEFGINVEGVSADFLAMMQRKEKIVTRLRMGVEFLLKNNAIDIQRGKGRFIDSKNIEVDLAGQKTTVTGNSVIVATGSKPSRIPGMEIDGKNVMTSDEMLSLTEFPKSLLIIGGGVIGCEFACIFSELGAQVTIVEMLPQILLTEDEEIAKTLRVMLEKRGIKILTDTKTNKLTNNGSSVLAELSDGSSIESEKVLVCTGRSANSADMGFEAIGLNMERGKILVNEKLQTNVPGIYAIGDVIGGIWLAHVAMHEGVCAAENIKGKDLKIDYSAVPGCIFTFPEIGSVGLTEKKAREQGMDILIGKFPFSACGKALAMGEPEGLVKIISDKNGKILGVHIVGTEATNLIAEAVVCMQNNMPVQAIMKTIHAHPTLPETMLEASLDVFGEAIHIPKKR